MGFVALYIVAVIGVSILLACIGWIAANDVLALNKQEKEVVITISSEDTFNDVVDKLEEELAELRQAVAERSNVEEELGDLLFAAAKAGRFLQIDAERALQKGCDKFIGRFRLVEKLTGDKPLSERPVEELEQLWRQAKEQVS